MEIIEIGKTAALEGRFRLNSALDSVSIGSQETPLPGRQQPPPEQIQVGKRKGGEQPGGVLRQAAITDFAKTP